MCIMIGLHWRPVQNIKPYNSPNYWIKLTTWLKLDDGYHTISAVRFEISRLILFHVIYKGQETSMENKRIDFSETSDGELKCWLTIQHKATREKSIKCAATIFVRLLWEIIRRVLKRINPFPACWCIEGYCQKLKHCPKNEQLVEQRSFEENYEISGTIFQPRVLSSDLPASRP